MIFAAATKPSVNNCSKSLPSPKVVKLKPVTEIVTPYNSPYSSPRVTIRKTPEKNKVILSAINKDPNRCSIDMYIL